MTWMGRLAGFAMMVVFMSNCMDGALTGNRGPGPEPTASHRAHAPRRHARIQAEPAPPDYGDMLVQDAKIGAVRGCTGPGPVLTRPGRTKEPT
jgi:hypothetical protein